jgi:catechol 2,3-dioxygenase-like lactoylglutathione lyase family enzyme
MISQRIALISLVVREYDEALAFYVGKLGFDLYRERGIEFVQAPKAEPSGR